jgi:hypothetical protein
MGGRGDVRPGKDQPEGHRTDHHGAVGFQGGSVDADEQMRSTPCRRARRRHPFHDAPSTLWNSAMRRQADGGSISAGTPPRLARRSPHTAGSRPTGPR